MLHAPWTFNAEPNPADPILSGFRIRDARGVVVAGIFTRPYPVVIDRENAATITAAPEMREALEAAEHWLAEEAESPEPGATKPDEILRVIRAALEKVRGEERHANGAPKWAPDGTLLDDKGNRSIFDDVDR